MHGKRVCSYFHSSLKTGSEWLWYHAVGSTLQYGAALCDVFLWVTPLYYYYYYQLLSRLAMLHAERLRDMRLYRLSVCHTPVY